MHIILHTVPSPKNPRQEFARKTWDLVQPMICEVHPTPVKTHGLAGQGFYDVKDVFDCALRLSRDNIFAYCNNDVALVPNWDDQMLAMTLNNGCSYGHRVDVPRFTTPLTKQDLVGKKQEAGADLWMCTPLWWKENRDKFPDGMIIGFEGFDFIMKWLMYKSGATKVLPVCYHERHISFWRRGNNLTDHPAQKMVRAIAMNWAEDVGVTRYILNPTTGYLFKRDDWP